MYKAELYQIPMDEITPQLHVVRETPADVIDCSFVVVVAFKSSFMTLTVFSL